MKKWTCLILSAAFVIPAICLSAQEDKEDGSRTPPPVVRDGARGPRGDRGGFRGGPRGEGFGGERMRAMNPVSARLDAEKALEEKYPEEFAALKKESAELEAKFQALAAKGGIKLPPTMEETQAKMENFRKNHEKELREIGELFRTDPQAAREKMEALYKAEGIEMPMFFGPAGNRDRSIGGAPAEARVPRMDINALKKAYPEEFAAIRKLQKDNPQEYRKQLRALYEKYEAEQKASPEKDAAK